MERSPFSARSPHDEVRMAYLRAAARDVLGLGEEAALLLTELRCTEQGCPPLETVLLIMAPDRPARQYKIHKAIADVTTDDLRAIAEGKDFSHE